LIVGVIVFIIVLVKTAGWMGWTSAFFYRINWPAILLIVGVIVIVAMIIRSGGPKKKLNIPPLTGSWAQPPAQAEG